MNLQERFRIWAAAKLTRAAAFVHTGGEPQSLAPYLDVDRVFSIFRMAEGGSTEELFTLYRDMMISDSHSQSEWAKRKLAVIGKPTAILPYNEEDAADMAAAEFIRGQVEGCQNWLFANGHLLDGTLYPVAVAEKVFAASGSGFALREIVAVPHRLLDFTSGSLRIREVNERGFATGSTVPPDPARYIVHRGHLLSAPDHFGGPMRSIVLWWLLSVMDRGWWARFLERFGAPFLVGKYDQADDASRRILERAFDFATKIGGLVVSRETEVEIKQAAGTNSGDGYERFLTICQREKSKLIIGQTLSAEAQSTGMNSGQSSAHEAVRDDIREFDAMMLSTTLRTRLFNQLMEINRVPGHTPNILWGGESAKEAGLTGTMLQALAQAGLRVTDKGIPTLSKKLGIPVERSPTPAAPVPFVTTFAVPPPAPELADLDRVATAGAADLAAAFRGELAPVATIIRESRTARECEERLREFTAAWKPDRSASVLEQALTAYAANGVLMSRFPGR